MQFGKAVILSAYPRTDGTQEVELDAVCPASNYERLNVVVGTNRVAVPLDRPARGAVRRFKVTLASGAPLLSQGDKVTVEFFFPGEQGGVRTQCVSLTGVN